MALKLMVGKMSCSKIPNPKQGLVSRKPHIFAHQESKIFSKRPWNKDSQVQLGQDQFSSTKHLPGWVFKPRKVFLMETLSSLFTNHTGKTSALEENKIFPCN